MVADGGDHQQVAQDAQEGQGHLQQDTGHHLVVDLLTPSHVGQADLLHGTARIVIPRQGTLEISVLKGFT